MRVFSYLRVSGKSQVEADGPKRQRAAIGVFCKANALELCGEYFERAVSGTTEAMGRPAFASMLEAICSSRLTHNIEPVMAIVVERMDRLARDLIVSELLMLECRKIGVAVYAADGNNLENLASDDCDPMRKFIRQVMGAAAELDKSMLVKKLAVARARKRAREGRCEGALPYGQKSQEHQILIAMRAYRDMGWSYEVIANQLNMGGLLSRRGKKWHKFAVARILTRKEKGDV